MSKSDKKNSNFKDLALLIGGLVYFVCPTDLIPDILGPLGFSDDLAALSMVFKSAIGFFSKSDIDKANEKAAKLLGDNFDPDKAAKMTKMIIGTKK